MAWTTPITWTVGGYVTALLMNQQVRDNLNHIKTRIDTAFPAAVQNATSGTWSTSSSTFADIGTFSLSYSYAASHNVLLWFTSNAKVNTAGGILRLDFNFDGSRVGDATEGWQNLYIDNAALEDSRFPITAMYLGTLASGSHTIKPQLAAGSATVEVGFGGTQFGYIVMGLTL